MAWKPGEKFTKTSMGRVVYNREKHFFSFRDIDRIVASILSANRVFYVDPNGDVYVENIIKNLQNYLQSLNLEEEDVDFDFMDSIFDFLVDLLGLVAPEWVTDLLKLMYATKPKYPGEEIPMERILELREDLDSVIGNVVDLGVDIALEITDDDDTLLLEDKSDGSRQR